jgi:serralysin
MALITVTQDRANVTGTPQDDSFVGRGNFLQVNGGPGADTIGDLGAQNTVHGGQGNDSIVSSTAGLTFGDLGDDTLVGRGDERVHFFDGGPGNDVIDGDLDDPPPFIAYVFYNQATSGVTVDLTFTGQQAVGGGQGIDTLRNLNGVIGSDFNDVLTGNGLLIGGLGDDRLVAGPFGAQFEDGVGNDTLIGGAGEDSVGFGRRPHEGVNNPGPSGPITIDLRIQTPQDIGGGMGVDTFVLIDHVFGGAFGDTLTGTDGRNVMGGNEGDDRLQGLGGDDVLNGHAGNDTVFGGAGDDFISDFFGGANLLLGEDGADQVFGGESFDTLHGNAGVDTLRGGQGADVVRGGQGDDVIFGEDGADWLAGDRGSDTLTGGAGGDVFHAWNGAGLDQVTDFNAAQGDRVFLLPGAAPTISQVGADTVIDFGGGERMMLVGVQLSSLPAGWIFGA